MKKRKKSFTMRKMKIIFLAIIFFLIGTTSVKIFNKSNNAAVAISVTDILNIMGEKNPINQALDEEIKQIEAKAEEDKKIAEEKAKEEERAKANGKENKNTKLAYLTFDDGPSKYVTNQILDILDEYDIKATFFILGKMVNSNPDVLKRIHEDGHSIGHHSYSHNYKYIYKDTKNFLGEVESTEKALKNVLGEEFETKLLRMPGGSFEKHKQKFLKMFEEMGYKNYNWNSLNGDAEGIGLSKEKLVNRVKATTKGKKEVIILMHDTDAKQTTVDGLPEIINYLINEGYEFRALSQE
ncbi:polysaccharide deacetylase [Tissierella pigra]|uniref:Polysaccharide deacetylase n=1 Tax=Tissierella pigra TaxID=2607614 RepID=A0A6N7XKT8_9FIRM|nr:polysaccharide deacetylase family protein [Tissierella pigra]MBU5426371.1 polysaccharide deacetylase [Tissierella pigra]MSU02196.1 polysaccharide deacetylase [Tissierella pigra]